MRATVNVEIEPDDTIEVLDLSDGDDLVTVYFDLFASISGTCAEIERTARRISERLGVIRVERARAAAEAELAATTIDPLVNAGTSGLSSATGVRACAACSDPVECSLVGCDHGAVA